MSDDANKVFVDTAKERAAALGLPPRLSGCQTKGNYRHGGYAGLTAFLKRLGVGEGRVAPRLWEQCAGAHAKKIGIRIITRRLGSDDTTTIYRIE